MRVYIDLKLVGGEGFLDSVGFDPALVGLDVDLQTVSHESGSEVWGDAAAHQAKGVGVAKVVGLDGDGGALEGVAEDAGQGVGGLGRSREGAEREALDPG